MVSNRLWMVMIPQNNVIVNKNHYSDLNPVFLAIIAKNLSHCVMILVQVQLKTIKDNNREKKRHSLYTWK